MSTYVSKETRNVRRVDGETHGTSCVEAIGAPTLKGSRVAACVLMNTQGASSYESFLTKNDRYL